MTSTGQRTAPADYADAAGWRSPGKRCSHGAFFRVFDDGLNGQLNGNAAPSSYPNPWTDGNRRVKTHTATRGSPLWAATKIEEVSIRCASFFYS